MRGNNVAELATAWRARCGEKWDADSAVLHILEKAGDHFDLDPAEFEEVDAALALLRAVLDDADKRAAAEPEAKDEPAKRLDRIMKEWGPALAKMGEGPRCSGCEGKTCTPAGCACPCHVGGAYPQGQAECDARALAPGHAGSRGDCGQARRRDEGGPMTRTAPAGGWPRGSAVAMWGKYPVELMEPCGDGYYIATREPPNGVHGALALAAEMLR